MSTQSTSWIEIDSFALIHNVRRVRLAIGEGASLLAVVKANAYGHGFDLATEAFWRGGVDGFIVADTAEALTLASGKYRVPILLLQPPTNNSDLAELIRRKVRLAGVSPEMVQSIQDTANRIGMRALVHMELETGMHRFGVPLADARTILATTMQPKSSVLIEGLFTHLSEPQTPEVAHQQLALVGDFLFELQQKVGTVPIVHILSSGGLTRYPQALYDGVRVGHALYGMEDSLLETEYALTWKTRILSVARIKKGDTVGYDGSYRALESKIVATLPIGYADGLPRAISNKGAVLCGGKRCPILGLISMNACVVDVSKLLHAAPGDEVVLLGKQQQQRITPAEMAIWADTIDYEIVSRLPRSIPRTKQR